MDPCPRVAPHQKDNGAGVSGNLQVALLFKCPTFASLFLIQGSPFNRADLNAVNANLAAMVVVLSPIVQAADSLNDNTAFADKEPIMASLNLKAMSFDDVTTVLQREIVAHLTKDEEKTTKVSQHNRTLTVSKLEEMDTVLPMITELG